MMTTQITKISGRYNSLISTSFFHTNIRLIRLSADLDDPVYGGQLEVARLEYPPPYYAISHAWIPGESPAVVQDGDELRLSKNLSTCIRRLQELSRQDMLSPPLRHIWIDNICIDQRDPLEKSCQVALMKEIYSQSVRTIIWLGEPESTSITFAWQLVSKIHDIFKEENPQAKLISDIPIRTYDEGRHLALGLLPLDDPCWGYLRRLMSERWFSRIWVIQEVVLSDKDPIVLHGNQMHAWEPLGWAAAWLQRSGYMRLFQIPEGLRNVDTISNLRRTATSWPLAALISITQVKFQATDQRDKIYGLLGLATECQGDMELPEALRPDYSLDVTVLYQWVASFLIGQEQSLAMLTRAKGLPGTETRHNRQHDLELPSWCPDWSDFKSQNLGVSTSLSWIHYPRGSSPAALGFPDQYRASGDLTMISRITNYSSILELHGFKADRIQNVHRFDVHRPTDGGELHNLEVKMIPALELALSIVPTYDLVPLVEGFLEVTTANQHQLNGKDASEGIADCAAWLWNLSQRPEDIPAALSKLKHMMSQLKEMAANGIPERYEALVRNFCFDRAFVTTSEGRMGIAPSNTRAGDAVLVIPGGGVPYIARRPNYCWFFVGESYIHGLMQGQALPTCNGPPLQRECFTFL